MEEEIRRRGLTKYEKDIIMKKQHYKCAICRRIDITKIPYIKDHVKPLKLGGRDNVRNIQFICPNCNAEKTRKDRHKIAKRKRRKSIWDDF